MLREAAGEGRSELTGLSGMGFTVDEAKAALAALAYDPEFYYLDQDAVTIWSSSTSGVVSEIELGYVVEGFELDGYRARLEAAAADALSWIDGGMTDAEKCQALHDYLIRTVVYDLETRDYGSSSAEPYNAYGALVSRRCVCDGYSEAYVLLLNRAGIEAQVVMSETMSHSWAVVLLDGQWYHVDVTWDDPTPDAGPTETPAYTYFLRGDDSMLVVGDQLHHDWRSVRQTLYETYGQDAVDVGAVSADGTSTPRCPADRSMQLYGVDQDARWPAGVNLAYPKVFDGPASGPATDVSVLPDGWYTEADGLTEAGRTYWIEGGAPARGLRDIDGAAYYFNETSAVMARGRFALVDGAVRRFDDDGRMAVGGREVGWWRYWFFEDGSMAQNTFVDAPDGRTLFFDPEGHMVVGEYQTPDGAWRCFGSEDGDMVRGTFIRMGGEERVCYYGEDGARVYGSAWIEGREFWFDPETGDLDEEGKSLLVW